jgi:small subunit ribosomal protein S16
MAVSIRLARHGSKKIPYYRIVVTDERNPRDGRFIENIGTFDPNSSDLALKIDRQRFEYWRGQGAQASHTVERLLKKNPAPASPAPAANGS